MNNEHPLIKSLRHEASIKLAERALALKAEGKPLCCHWCKREIVSIRSIPAERRLETTHQGIRYLDDWGREVWGLMATTDHLIPLSEGGRNGDGNLVPSCKSCNTRRNMESNRDVI